METSAVKQLTKSSDILRYRDFSAPHVAMISYVFAIL